MEEICTKSRSNICPPVLRARWRGRRTEKSFNIWSHVAPNRLSSREFVRSYDLNSFMIKVRIWSKLLDVFHQFVWSLNDRLHLCSWVKTRVRSNLLETSYERQKLDWAHGYINEGWAYQWSRWFWAVWRVTLISRWRLIYMKKKFYQVYLCLCAFDVSIRFM